MEHHDSFSTDKRSVVHSAWLPTAACLPVSSIHRYHMHDMAQNNCQPCCACLQGSSTLLRPRSCAVCVASSWLAAIDMACSGCCLLLPSVNAFHQDHWALHFLASGSTLKTLSEGSCMCHLTQVQRNARDATANAACRIFDMTQPKLRFACSNNAKAHCKGGIGA